MAIIQGLLGCDVAGMQVAGLRYVFNASRTTPTDYNQPLQAKDRLVYAKLVLAGGLEKDIDPCAKYSVISNEYLTGVCAVNRPAHARSLPAERTCRMLRQHTPAPNLYPYHV